MTGRLFLENMSMRIHFICKRHYTNKDLIEDQFGRLYHLPMELARLGAQVIVDAIDYKNKFAKERDTEGVLFRSIPAAPAKLFSLPFSLYRNVSDVNPNIIVASGDSHIGFMAMLIAYKLNAQFVFDVYDYYPAFLGNKIPGMKMMFRRAVKGANLVLCASEPLLCELLPLNANRLLVENGVDRSLFVSEDMMKARKILGLSQEAIFIGYFGSIDSNRGPLLIEACRILRQEMPLLHLVIAGNVSRVDLSENWIMYYGEVSQSKLPQLINACNLVAVPYAITPQITMSGACKIAEYLSCGKTVVATRVAAHERIFMEAPSSLCDPTSESLAEAIRCQILNPNVVAFPEELSWKKIGEKLYNSFLIMTEKNK